MPDINLRRPQEGGMRAQRSAPEQDSMPMGEDAYNGEMPTSRGPRKSGAKGSWIVLLAIVIIVVVLGFLFKDKLFAGSESEDIATGDYQAVFLTNGQVYFGHLADAEKTYLKLDNIYYLQVTPVLQTRTPDDPTQPPIQEQQQQLSLVKLGNELHGPVDEMFINRDQVLFIEDLKEDGRVVQAIKDYETGQQ